MPRHEAPGGSRNSAAAPPRRAVFWKVAFAGAAFQGGSSAVDSATVVSGLVFHLTGSTYAVGFASAVLRLGWLLPQLLVGFFAGRAERRMPFYVGGALGRATCLAMIAGLFVIAGGVPEQWVAAGFLILWTIYAFVSGVVAVPYNDIVGRSIGADSRSRMLAWRFFGGGILALGLAAIVDTVLRTKPLFAAYASIFALAAALMFVSSFSFISAGEPPAGRKKSETPVGFRWFLSDGLTVLRSNARFRLFLYSQWLGGATMMALPFYIVSASDLGFGVTTVGLLLGAQTAGSLASNAIWGYIGDTFGKLALLRAVGLVRLLPPLGALAIMSGPLSPAGGATLAAFVLLFVVIGALVNGMMIGYLGYLMEISPNEQRPAYSAYFNSLAAPAALLPLLGAAIADVLSLAAVFIVAALCAAAQQALYGRLAHLESR